MARTKLSMGAGAAAAAGAIPKWNRVYVESWGKQTISDVALPAITNGDLKVVTKKRVVVIASGTFETDVYTLPSDVRTKRTKQDFFEELSDEQRDKIQAQCFRQFAKHLSKLERSDEIVGELNEMIVDLMDDKRPWGVTDPSEFKPKINNPPRLWTKDEEDDDAAQEERHEQEELDRHYKRQEEQDNDAAFEALEERHEQAELDDHYKRQEEQYEEDKFEAFAERQMQAELDAHEEREEARRNREW
jgi:hypothetical protein